MRAGADRCRLPDLTSDRLPDEEKELGFDRRGRALKPTKRSEPGDLDIRARRLKLVTIRCAQLLGLTEQVELLKEKSRQWFAERRHLTVGQVIRAVHPLIEPMKDIPNAEDVD